MDIERDEQRLTPHKTSGQGETFDFMVKYKALKRMAALVAQWIERLLAEQ